MTVFRIGMRVMRSMTKITIRYKQANPFCTETWLIEDFLEKINGFVVETKLLRPRANLTKEIRTTYVNNLSIS